MKTTKIMMLAFVVLALTVSAHGAIGVPNFPVTGPKTVTQTQAPNDIDTTVAIARPGVPDPFGFCDTFRGVTTVIEGTDVIMRFSLENMTNSSNRSDASLAVAVGGLKTTPTSGTCIMIEDNDKEYVEMTREQLSRCKVIGTDEVTWVFAERMSVSRGNPKKNPEQNGPLVFQIRFPAERLLVGQNVLIIRAVGLLWKSSREVMIVFRDKKTGFGIRDQRFPINLKRLRDPGMVNQLSDEQLLALSTGFTSVYADAQMPGTIPPPPTGPQTGPPMEQGPASDNANPDDKPVTHGELGQFKQEVLTGVREVVREEIQGGKPAQLGQTESSAPTTQEGELMIRIAPEGGYQVLDRQNDDGYVVSRQQRVFVILSRPLRSGEVVERQTSYINANGTPILTQPTPIPLSLFDGERRATFFYLSDPRVAPGEHALIVRVTAGPNGEELANAGKTLIVGGE